MLRVAAFAMVAAATASTLQRAARSRLAGKGISLCSASCPAYGRSSHKRCLLISNSKLSGMAYLDHVMEHIKTFLGELDAGAYIVFVPYAQRGRDMYADKLRSALVGYEVKSLHDGVHPEERLAMVRGAAAIFVGGGNTYRLLKCLQQDEGLLALIAERVTAGDLAYIGSSAGTNLACPTIRNTNDMPIVWPEAGLHGLCLVPFQINTHYIDAERELQHHMGETRAKRLEEFTEENDVPVLALREGSSVLVEGEAARLLGPTRRSADVTWEGARLIRRASDGGPREVGVGESLDALMELGQGEGDAQLGKLFDVAPLLSDEGVEAAPRDGFKSG